MHTRMDEVRSTSEPATRPEAVSAEPGCLLYPGVHLIDAWFICGRLDSMHVVFSFHTLLQD